MQCPHEEVSALSYLVFQSFRRAMIIRAGADGGSCGATNGMFLDIRRWSLLLLYAGNGSYIPMPYTDQYGDLDHR